MAFSCAMLGLRFAGDRDGHTTTVASYNYLIPQEKPVPRNRGAIFVILSIKIIHRSDYVSSLTVPEPAV
jgi:hypothetical protein